MRQHDPRGEKLPPEGYVFGNAVGEGAKSVRTDWEKTLTRAGIAGLHHIAAITGVTYLTCGYGCGGRGLARLVSEVERW